MISVSYLLCRLEFGVLGQFAESLSQCNALGAIGFSLEVEKISRGYPMVIALCETLKVSHPKDVLQPLLCGICGWGHIAAIVLIAGLTLSAAVHVAIISLGILRMIGITGVIVVLIPYLFHEILGPIPAIIIGWFGMGHAVGRTNQVRPIQLLIGPAG